MNYRHAYHAGNFADVFKHIILARLVTYMKGKELAFRVYDTHAGLGRYDLDSEEAGKTGEAELGVSKVLAATTSPAVAEIIGPWKEAVAASPEGTYPGSPAIARHLLRKQDRLTLYELHEEDHPVLAANFAGDYQTRVQHLDGWLAPGAHTPPKEARGIMLIDPPFEDGHDFDRMIDALLKCRKRWAGGTVALWYPVKKRDHTDEWLGSLQNLAFPDLLNAELVVKRPNDPKSLNGCGMVIANPPYTLRDELNTLLPWLAGVLRQQDGLKASDGIRIQNLSKR